MSPRLVMIYAARPEENGPPSRIRSPTKAFPIEVLSLTTASRIMTRKPTRMPAMMQRTEAMTLFSPGFSFTASASSAGRLLKSCCRIAMETISSPRIERIR